MEMGFGRWQRGVAAVNPKIPNYSRVLTLHLFGILHFLKKLQIVLYIFIIHFTTDS